MPETLPYTFSSSGWDIKYNLIEPQPHPNKNSTGSPTQTLIFVHGTPWSSQVFLPLASALSATSPFRILLYDLAGYGASQSRIPNASQHSVDEHGFEGDTSVATQAKIFCALLAHLKLDGKRGKPPPAIIAHDIAGTIVLHAHLLHGCEFASLLLLDTNAVLPWGDGFYKLVRANPRVFVEMPGRIFEAVVRAVIRSAICRAEVMSTGWEDVLAGPWVESSIFTSEDGRVLPGERQRSFVRQIAQANDADVAEMLDQGLYAKIRCDVEIMWGEKDDWVPRHKMDELADLLGDRLKGFVVVPEAGHLLMIDQPEQVTSEVISWLMHR